MSESWDITFRHVDGRRDWETRSYSVPDEDLQEVQDDLATVFPRGYEVAEAEDWEGIDFKTRRFSAGEIWEIAEIANAQESPAAFLAWVAETNAVSLGIPDDLEQRFQQAYRGEFDDLKEYAQSWAEDHGIDTAIWPYVDWEKFGRSMASDYKVCDLSTGKIAILSHG